MEMEESIVIVRVTSDEQGSNIDLSSKIAEAASLSAEEEKEKVVETLLMGLLAAVKTFRVPKESIISLLDNLYASREKEEATTKGQVPMNLFFQNNNLPS